MFSHNRHSVMPQGLAGGSQSLSVINRALFATTAIVPLRALQGVQRAGMMLIHPFSVNSTIVMNISPVMYFVKDFSLSRFGAEGNYFLYLLPCAGNGSISAPTTFARFDVNGVISIAIILETGSG